MDVKSQVIFLKNIHLIKLTSKKIK